MTLHTYPGLEVISRNTSPNGFVNHNNSNSGNSSQGNSSSSTIPRVNIIVGNDIKLPIFNGNGLKDLEQHWFLCEVVWIVRQVQYEAIKRDQMITTLICHVLD